MRRLLLGLVVAAATLVPNIAQADDQEIARHIMSTLQLEQQRGALKGFHVDMRVDQGTVWYKGFVSSQDQKDLILRTAQQAQNLGVVQVVDDISVKVDEPAAAPAEQTTAPAEQAAAPAEQAAAPAEQAAAPATTVEAQQTAFYQEAQPTPAIQQARPQMSIPTPTMGQIRNTAIQNPGIQAQPAIQSQAAGIQGPPMAMNAGIQMPVAGDTAALPAYAWPSYAAHPNYAAVTYPGQYSASAWPYIGPFYPYPQVPLGWRKVTLEWDDGWWWLDFNNRPR